MSITALEMENRGNVHPYVQLTCSVGAQETGVAYVVLEYRDASGSCAEWWQCRKEQFRQQIRAGDDAHFVLFWHPPEGSDEYPVADVTCRTKDRYGRRAGDRRLRVCWYGWAADEC